MKVIQINQNYGIGDSTGRTTMEMHKYLLDIGIDSKVYCCNVLGEPITTSQVEIFGNTFDRKLHALLSRVSGRQAYYSHAVTRKLVRMIKNDNPDIVILRVLHGNIINFPMLLNALYLLNCGVVLVLHDCWFFTGHCWYYSKCKCNKWKNGCVKCDFLSEGNRSWFFDNASRNYKDKQRLYDKLKKLTVVGVSKWIAEDAKLSMLKDRKITYIYNWIDQSVFYPRPIREKREKVIVLAVSTFWTKNKGWEDVLFIAESCPEYEIWVIGNILDENSNIPNNVVKMGMISSVNKLAECYSMADVFINPSVQETFGKTTAEALCCGTPVVAYNTTACNELIDQSRGMLVELGNSQAFSNAVMQVVEKGKKQYEQACVSYANDMFDYNKNMKLYMELFESMTNTN